MSTKLTRGGWERVPEHDAWIKSFHFNAVRGWSRITKHDIAIRRESKGSKIWRVDHISMGLIEALTPTKHRTAAAAKAEAEAIYDEFSRRRAAGEEIDVDSIAYRISREGSPRDREGRGARGSSRRDPTSVPNIILAQLGGRRFIAMTGAQVSSEHKSLIVKLPRGTTRKSIRAMVVTLEPSDTYSVRFVSQTRSAVRTVAKFDNVYAEDLRRIFEETTGLYTSLGTMGRDPGQTIYGRDAQRKNA